MAKGQQRSNKMVKKPKKDAGTSLSGSSSTSDRPVQPPTTLVMPKGKVKKT